MIQAIETSYNGYRFRSRLEARWAVFFDAIDQKYRYETEGYVLSGIPYLPDFQILSEPGINGYGDMIETAEFVEIKPTDPTRQEWNKAVLLASESGNTVNIFAGDPDIDVEIYQICSDIMGGELPEFLTNIPSYAADKTIAMPPYTWSHAYWKQCVRCLRVQLVNIWMTDPDGVDTCIYCSAEKRGLLDVASPDLLKAYRAARSARFEFGETPKVLRGKSKVKVS